MQASAHRRCKTAAEKYEKVLGNVKKEFENFGGHLEEAQKNIQTGLGQLDDVVGLWTTCINRELRNVERLPTDEGKVENYSSFFERVL